MTQQKRIARSHLACCLSHTAAVEYLAGNEHNAESIMELRARFGIAGAAPIGEENAC